MSTPRLHDPIDISNRISHRKSTDTYQMYDSIEKFYLTEIQENFIVELYLGDTLISYTDVFEKISTEGMSFGFGFNLPLPEYLYEVKFFKNDVIIETGMCEAAVKLFGRSGTDEKQPLDFYYLPKYNIIEHGVIFQDCVTNHLRSQNQSKLRPEFVEHLGSYHNYIRFLSGMCGFAYNHG